MFAGLVAGALLAGLGQEAEWNGLPPGPHPVGFLTSWQLDHGRTYHTAFDDGRDLWRRGRRPVPCS